MDDSQLLILGGKDVESLLAGRDEEVVDAVRLAYLAHHGKESSLPHSTFLRFPDDQTNRIIGLPAYLGDGFEVAGMKWIASFPGNVGRGLPRASAVLVINSCENGRPQAILEGSVISARRTAASAALAAATLRSGETTPRVGLVGAGLINRETARFLTETLPGIAEFVVFDLDRARAQAFADGLPRVTGAVEATVADRLEAVLESCALVAFATTAATPHVDDLSSCPRGTTILHTSLRDLAPEVILGCDNVVDDPDHVCRAQTSIHLAEELSGDRRFIRCTLAEILEGTAPPKSDPEAVTVFSPFGLGILDLAVGKLVLDLARARGWGTLLDSFLPTS